MRAGGAGCQAWGGRTADRASSAMPVKRADVVVVGGGIRGMVQ
jgi:hypothetical protein